MDWTGVAWYAERLFGAWLFLIIGLVVLRMLSGAIITTGLLRLETHAPFGMDRLQLLFVTLLFTAGYVIASLAQAPGEGLPNIATPILLVLIGSNGTYVAVKYANMMSGQGRKR